MRGGVCKRGIPVETGRMGPTELWRCTAIHHPREVVGRLESIYDSLKLFRDSQLSATWSVGDVQKQKALSRGLERALPAGMTIVNSVNVFNRFTSLERNQNASDRLAYPLYCRKYWHVVVCVRVLSAHWNNGGHDGNGHSHNGFFEEVQKRRKELGWEISLSAQRVEVKARALEIFLGLPLKVPGGDAVNVYDGLLAIDKILAMTDGMSL